MSKALVAVGIGAFLGLNGVPTLLDEVDAGYTLDGQNSNSSVPGAKIDTNSKAAWWYSTDYKFNAAGTITDAQFIDKGTAGSKTILHGNGYWYKNGMQPCHVTFVVDVDANGKQTVNTTINTINAEDAPLYSDTTNLSIAAPAGYPSGGDIEVDVVDVSGAPVVVPVEPTVALVDGIFATPSVGTGPSAYKYNPSGGAWLFEGQSGLQGDGSAWGAMKSPSGTQTAFIQSGTPGRISQKVNFAADGDYVLSVYLARRDIQIQPVQPLLDGAAIGGLLMPGSTAFQEFRVPFSAKQGLRDFALIGTVNAGDNSTFVAAISITKAVSTDIAPQPDAMAKAA